MRFLIFILLLAAASVINACFNPFFPETTHPPLVPSSPERTVQLLREAYEQKDIDAFVRLIYSTADYASYTQISAGYTTGLSNLSAQPSVQIDSVFTPGSFAPGFLPSNRFFHELRWADEHRIHRNMFTLSDEIVFMSPLVVAATLFETDGRDTVSALVRTNSSRIRIKVRDEEFTIDINGQIFAMKRDNGVWKIWKWVELN